MAVTAIPRSHMAQVEEQIRIDLAACYRLVDLFGWSDLINTRITARVNCVIHTHTVAGCAVSMQKGGLLPLNQHALQVIGDVAYHDYEGTGRSLEERERFLADFGDKHIMVLRNHGLFIPAACRTGRSGIDRRDKRRCRSGSRIHNRIIGWPRPDGGPAPDRPRP